MIIDKVETNIKRNLFLKQTNNIKITRFDSINLNKFITLDTSIEFQEFLGFGGAFTESAGYALSIVDEKNYNQILDDYFLEDGLNYNFGRLPIGSCDFSLKSYSYSYKKDLSDFSIDKDKEYIIPTINAALLRNENIKFIASPWSPPAFMKNNKLLILGGKLKEKYMQTWANYLVKYINCYKNEGINIDYMTIQNEPEATQMWESCKYSAKEEANLLVNYLYPTFKQHNINTKFLIWDHNKNNIVERVNDCLIKYNALNYADGIAFHWYTGSYFENLKEINKTFPSKLLIHTEGCTGYSKFKPEDELFNAEMYASEILGDLNSGINAFVDWNLVLDYNGGPNHKKNYCNSPIMINKDKTSYIKTPVFYYIGQFSKYIKHGSKRIYIDNPYKDIQSTAFKNIDGTISIILFNKNDFNIEYDFCYKNYIFHDNLDSHAIVTLNIK